MLLTQTYVCFWLLAFSVWLTLRQCPLGYVRGEKSYLLLYQTLLLSNIAVNIGTDKDSLTSITCLLTMENADFLLIYKKGLVPSPGLVCSECSPIGRPEPMSALGGPDRAVVSSRPSHLSPIPALQPGWCCGAGCTIASPMSVSACTAGCKAGLRLIFLHISQYTTSIATLGLSYPPCRVSLVWSRDEEPLQECFGFSTCPDTSLPLALMSTEERRGRKFYTEPRWWRQPKVSVFLGDCIFSVLTAGLKLTWNRPVSESSVSSGSFRWVLQISSRPSVQSKNSSSSCWSRTPRTCSHFRSTSSASAHPRDLKGREGGQGK